jgi:cytoskeletal protein CcmA (bactofilin family)
MATYFQTQNTVNTRVNTVVGKPEPMDSPVSKPAAQLSEDPTSIHIGEGVVIVGSITLPGHALVNGRVEGQLQAGSLEIGKSGQVRGKVSAKTMAVAGELEHEVTCTEHFHLHSTGKVGGRLLYAELQIDRGGKFMGEMVQLKPTHP